MFCAIASSTPRPPTSPRQPGTRSPYKSTCPECLRWHRGGFVATFVRVAPDSTGTKIQTTEVVDGADTVARQHTRIDGAALAEVADVRNAAPTDTDYGVVVRPIVSGILYSGTLGAMNAAGTTDDRAIGCSLILKN